MGKNRKNVHTNINRGLCGVTFINNSVDTTKHITTQIQIDQVYTLMYVIYNIHCSKKFSSDVWVNLIHSSNDKKVVGQPHVLIVNGNTFVAVHFIFILNITDFLKNFIPQQALAWTYNDIIIIRVASHKHIAPLKQFLITITAQHKKATGRAPEFIVYINKKSIDELQLQQAKQYNYHQILKFGDNCISRYYTSMLHRGDSDLIYALVHAIINEYFMLVDNNL